MGFGSSFKTWLSYIILPLLVEVTMASSLADYTPCPDCASSIAPPTITITAQYESISVCRPLTTTILSTYVKEHRTRTVSKTQTMPSCSPDAWVSTTVPVYYNWTEFSTIVTTTNQPVTFHSLHYTEAHTTTLAPRYSHPRVAGSYHNDTGHNGTHTKGSLKVSYTTIDIKKYCDYDSIGPLAIPHYAGSGLCTDCGPDQSGSQTQRLTVVECSDLHCKTFNETWVASPRTYASSGRPYTVTTTNTYGPGATPETANPGSMPSPPSDTARTSLIASASDHFSATPASRTGYRSQSRDTLPMSSSGSHRPSNSNFESQTPRYPEPSAQGSPPGTSRRQSVSSSYSPPTPTPTATADHPPSEPTEGYGGGAGADPSADVSGDVQYEAPTPTAYHARRNAVKVFQRQGLEKPRGKVMRRSGLLFWGT